MSILRVLQYPDPRLKNKVSEVEDINSKEIQDMIDNLIVTMRSLKNCGGLAASQVDLQNPKRIAVIEESSQDKQLLCFVNPRITASEGEVFEEEGCMSIYPAKINAKVKRASKVTVDALDRFGKPFTLQLSGYLARCIQHEIDHLDGIIYLDRLSPLRRQLVEKKIRKIIVT